MSATGVLVESMSAHLEGLPADGPRSDHVLLQQYFRNDDREALGELFSRHTDAAYRIALSITGDSADAEDAVQTAFLQVLMKSSQNISNVRGWIMGIVVHTCQKKVRDEVRRRTRHEAITPMAEKQLAAPDEERAELVNAAIRIVKHLPEHYRLPIWLHFLEGYSFADTACALSLSEGTVREQTRRGIEQVRQSLIAARFSVGIAAIPDVLASSVQPTAPAALTGTLKTMALAGGVKCLGATTAAPAAKGLFAVASSKLVMTAVLLLASATAVVAIMHSGGFRIEPRLAKLDGDEKLPVVTVASPKADERPLNIDQSLAAILERKIDVNFIRYPMWRTADELQMRTHIRLVFPVSVGQTPVTISASAIAVKDLLQRIAGHKFSLEYAVDTAALWNRADDRRITELTQAVQDGEVRARSDAICKLGATGDRRACAALLSLLGDRDATIRMWSVFSLGNFTNILRFVEIPKNLASELIKTIPPEKEAAYRSGVIELAGATGDPAIEDKLIDFLKNGDLQTRIAAANALGHYRSRAAVDALCETLGTQPIILHEAASSALEQIRDDAAMEAILNLHSREDSYVFDMRVLGKLSPEKLRPKLDAVLAGNNAIASNNALQALGFLRSDEMEQSSAVLLKYLNDGDAKLRRSAAWGLWLGRFPHTTDALIKAFNACSDSREKKFLLYALGALRERDATEWLAAHVDSLEPEFQSAALRALASSGDLRAVDKAVALIRKGNVDYDTIDALTEANTEESHQALSDLAKDNVPGIATALCYTCSEEPKAIDGMLQFFAGAQSEMANVGVLWAREHYLNTADLTTREKIKTAIDAYYERIKDSKKPPAPPGGDF